MGLTVIKVKSVLCLDLAITLYESLGFKSVNQYREYIKLV